LEIGQRFSLKLALCVLKEDETMITLRIFVSSPGDVGEERALAQDVLKRLSGEFISQAKLEPIFWEHEPLRASAPFQEQIPSPGDTDIVICILWSRLGTRLPGHITRPDGSTYESGTEYEFEIALNGFGERGFPDLLVYRKTAPPPIPADDEERWQQFNNVRAFIRKWFQGTDGSFTAAFHTFEEPTQFAELLETHLRKLIEPRLPAVGGVPLIAPPLWQHGSPFRGLQAFDFEHSSIFCGRTQAISDVLNALRTQAADGRAFVLVLGMSGVGKSSVVRAGVLPKLNRPGVIEGIGVWRRAVVRPSDAVGDLCDGLAAALLRQESLPELAENDTTCHEFARLLRKSPEDAVPLIKIGLSQAALEIQRAEQLPQKPTARLALVVDQFEEAFLERFTTAERLSYVAAISALARSGHVWIIATLRSDFFPRCSELPELLALKEGAGQYDLRPPTPAEVGQMIRQPAQLGGLRFGLHPETAEPLDDVLRDAATRDPYALPLLEFTLEELYKNRTDEGVLTHDGYEKLGGIAGALANRADEVFNSLSPDAQAALPSVLSMLVGLGLGPQESIFRKRARLDAVMATPESKVLVERFVADRLFTTDRADDDMAVVSVAHEALLRHWPPITQWIDQNRIRLRTRARIAAAAAVWREQEGATSFLLPRGKSLNAAEALLAQNRADFTSREVAYIKASRTRARQRVFAQVILAALLLIAVGTGLWYWDTYYRTHSEYYSAFIMRWGTPEGLKRLTEEQISRRQATIKLIRQGRKGPVHELQIVDSRGRCPYQPFVLWSLEWLNPLADTTTEGIFRLPEMLVTCRVTFARDATGSVIDQRAYNRNGRMLFELHYPSPNTAHYKEGDFPLLRRESGLSHVQFLRFDSVPKVGLAQEIRFFDAKGQTQPANDGSFGQRFVLDDRGLPIEIIELGADGQPAINKWGLAKTKRTYDEWGNLARDANFGPDDQLILGPSGTAIEELTSDAYGNVTGATNLGLEGQLVTSKEGMAAVTRAYDDRGYVTEFAFFGPDRQPARGPLGFAKVTVVFDEKGRALETYFGADGKPKRFEAGFVKGSVVRDERGNVIEMTYLDENQRPVHISSGFTTSKYKYDGLGNQIEAAFFDENDQPVRSNVGYAKVKWAYDNRGNKIEEAYFRPDGQPALYEETYVSDKLKYNAQGKVIEIEYRDIAGQLVKCKAGYAKVKQEYDQQGNRIERAYLDEHDRPARHTEGNVRWTARYDERGNEIERNFFDEQGRLVRLKDGYAQIRSKYNQRGDLIEQTFFDENGRPALHKWGYAKLQQKYDELGRVIMVAYTGLDGAPVVHLKYGYAMVRLAYDSNGKLSQGSYFGANGRPGRGSYGYAKLKLVYDDLQREIARTYLDGNDNPVRTQVAVIEVEPNSKAQRLGLREGDIILAYDGDEVANLREFEDQETARGERQRELKILRNGNEFNIQVDPGRVLGLDYNDKVSLPSPQSGFPASKKPVNGP
jgi:YD repeat-containing protein